MDTKSSTLHEENMKATRDRIENSSPVVDEGLVDEVDEKDCNVFANTNGEGPDFRGVSCIAAAVLIAKSQFALGVVGIPQTFHVLGFLPGMIVLCGLCVLCTWTGVVVGKFRLNHPQVHSIGDATYLMFGKVGCEIMGFAFWLLYTLTYGAGLLTVSIAFNSMTEHATCTMAWVGVAAGLSLALGIVTRTMKVLSWCGYVALVSLFIAVWIVVIACLAQKTPAAAPPGEPINKDIRLLGNMSSYAAISGAIGTQVLSLCGTASFFTIHAEMRDQKKYVKSVLLGQGFVVINYILVACIIYGKVGQYVASPSLGSAGPMIKKISYGISMPALIFSCFFQAHVAAKYGLVRMLRGTSHLQSNTKTHWATWIGNMTLVIAVGLIVAGAIPFFDDLLGLIGSLLGTSFMLIFPGYMVLYDFAKVDATDKECTRPLLWFKKSMKQWTASKKNLFLTCLAWFVIILGYYITASGVYGTVTNIVQGYANGDVGRPYPCEDNSNS
jgi:hypothetical protein